MSILSIMHVPYARSNNHMETVCNIEPYHPTSESPQEPPKVGDTATERLLGLYAQQSDATLVRHENLDHIREATWVSNKARVDENLRAHKALMFKMKLCAVGVVCLAAAYLFL
jgi:hypothetical protein